MRRKERGCDAKVDLRSYREGRDELNLVELPLAGISDRFLSGEKTVVFTDTVWDEEKNTHLKRKLSISGSDMYGLPTAKDDDVLLACVQLSSIGDFHNREVHFSRYELLKLLRWKDETKNYRRLSESLRRWKGLTIYSDRAFYDHGAKSWVNRDFSIFDNLFIYEREEQDKGRGAAKSRFVWNDVLFSSFQAGYLKKLDWDLYLSLKDPVAKRLYRLLDKRFYRRNSVTMKLDELAFNKVRVSRGYNTAQMKRSLMNGIRELEAVWDLVEMPAEERFRKIGRGQWEAVFIRRTKKPRSRPKENSAATGLVHELSKRGVNRDVAEQLVKEQPEERVRNMIELFDWHNSRGEVRGPGFLVAGIRSEEEFTHPKGFQRRSSQAAKKPAPNSRNWARRKYSPDGAAEERKVESPAQRAFSAFWAGLSDAEQTAFERQALASSETTKRDGYLRLLKLGGPVFEQYRQIILRDHFEKRARGTSTLAEASQNPLQKTWESAV